MTETPKASVGRIVHYVSYGTPGGEYSRECRAAIVTEVDPTLIPPGIGLCVLNPTGMFFNRAVPCDLGSRIAPIPVTAYDKVPPALCGPHPYAAMGAILAAIDNYAEELAILRITRSVAERFALDPADVTAVRRAELEAALDEHEQDHPVGLAEPGPAAPEMPPCRNPDCDRDCEPPGASYRGKQGYCGRCYYRWRNHGFPPGGPPPPVLTRTGPVSPSRDEYMFLRSQGVPQDEAAARLGVARPTAQKYEQRIRLTAA